MNVEHEVCDERASPKGLSNVLKDRDGGATDKVTSLEVVRGVAAEISTSGQENMFMFEVDHAGRHVVETTGSTDVVLALYGPGSKLRKIAENDDGGRGDNARIALDLQVGVYYAAVRHYDPDTGTGAYRIRVTAG